MATQSSTFFWLHKGSTRLGALVVIAVAGLAFAGDSSSLLTDGLHDPLNPALRQLQEPSETKAGLPRESAGAAVNWGQALEQGFINPRGDILRDVKPKIRKDDILMPKTGIELVVRFPHKQHTQWVDCKNCHDEIFQAQAGATPNVNMFTILQGESCGVCHGAVAFPLTECKRCHSEPRK
jgi:c(7)-type cytochrome triheme protein